MAKDIDVLRSLASQIKNEVEDGKNTASRIGGMFVDVVDKMESTRTEAKNDALNVVNPKIEQVEGEVDDLALQMGEVAIPTTESGKFINLSGGVGSVAPVDSPSNNAGYRYMLYSCAEGDIITINGKGGGNARLWAFLDENNVILSVAYGNEEATDKVKIAPKNSAFIVINDMSNSTSYYNKATSLSNEIKANKSDIDDLEQSIESVKQDYDSFVDEYRTEFAYIRNNNLLNIWCVSDGTATYNAGNESAAIQVLAGDEYSIEANDEKDTFITFVESLPNVSSGTNVDINNIGSRIQIAKGGKKVGIVPSGATYVIISTKYVYSEGDYCPNIVSISGKCYYGSQDAYRDKVTEEIAKKQDTLSSGGNIKTINGKSILGEGNVEITDYFAYEYRNASNKTNINKSVMLVDGEEYAVKLQNTTGTTKTLVLKNSNGDTIQTLVSSNSSNEFIFKYEPAGEHEGFVYVYCYISSSTFDNGGFISLNIYDKNSQIFSKISSENKFYPTNNDEIYRKLVAELYVKGISKDDENKYYIMIRKHYGTSSNSGVFLYRNDTLVSQYQSKNPNNESVVSSTSGSYGISFVAVVNWEFIEDGKSSTKCVINKDVVRFVENSKIIYATSKLKTKQTSGNPSKYIGAIVYDGWKPMAKINFSTSNAIYQSSDKYVSSSNYNNLNNRNVYDENGDVKIPSYIPYSLTEQEFVDSINSIISGDGTKIEDWTYYVYATEGKFPPSQASFCGYYPTDAATIAKSTSKGLSSALPSRKPISSYSYDMYVVNEESKSSSLQHFETELGWCNTISLDQIEAQIDMAHKYGIDYFAILCTGSHNIAKNGYFDNDMFVHWNRFITLFNQARNRNKIKFCIIVDNVPTNIDDYNLFMQNMYEKFCNKSNYLHLNGRPVIMLYKDLASFPYNLFNPAAHIANTLIYAKDDGVDCADGRFWYSAVSSIPTKEQYETKQFLEFERSELNVLETKVSSNSYGNVIFPYCIGRAMAARANFESGIFEVNPPEKEEIISSMQDLIDFAKTTDVGDVAILIYAWNEFCEGGWLMPTQYEIDNNKGFYRLEAIKAIKDSWIGNM